VADLDAFDPAAEADVASFVRTLQGPWGPIDTRIGAGDEMYAFEHSGIRSAGAAATAYFFTGHQLFGILEDVVRWRFGGFAQVGEFLDFASGFGRVTRFFVRALSPGRVVVAEIDPAAVAFQEAAFGVRGIVSATDPSAFTTGGRRFDLVLVSSLFSHLPPHRFEQWLRVLYAALKPSGVLAFSVHGLGLIEDGGVDKSSGFVFAPVSETSRLEKAEYGSAYVSEQRVHELVRGAVGGDARLFSAPLTFGVQDLYLLVRPPVPDLPGPGLPRPPSGAIDFADIVDGVVSAEGWVKGSRDEAAPTVRLFLKERPGRVEPLPADVPGMGRWRFRFPVDAVGPDGLVRIEAESARGRPGLIFVGSLRPYLERAGRSD